MSLCQLSAWCRERYGDHPVSAVPEMRRFDIPWLVMDSTLAGEVWGWRPETPLQAILEEIALHAEAHPDWLETSGVS
jgi:CDP-paratose 2-epimerase